MRNGIKVFFLLLISFCVSVTAEEKKTFNSLNPFFKDEIPIQNIKYLKNKTFHTFSESFSYDENDNKTYGDTYDRTVYNAYWTFDGKGRVEKYVIETVQLDQIISFAEYRCTYERNKMIVHYVRKSDYQDNEYIFTLDIIRKDDCIVFVNTPKKISGNNSSKIRFSSKKIFSDKTIIEYSLNPSPVRNLRDEVEWITNEFIRFTTVYSETSKTITEKKLKNGILMEEKNFKDEIGAITQVYTYSVAEGTGTYRYYRDNTLEYEAILTRKLNPIGFLEYESVKLEGSEKIYKAEIIPKR